MEGHQYWEAFQEPSIFGGIKIGGINFDISQNLGVFWDPSIFVYQFWRPSTRGPEPSVGEASIFGHPFND